MSKRSRSLAAVLLVLALLVSAVLFTRSARTGALARADGIARIDAPAPPSLSPAESAREVAHSAPPAAELVAIDATTSSPTPGAAQERAWITLRIYDEYGAKVAGATVDRLWLLNAGQRSTTATPETSPERSGSDGVLKLAYPRRFDRERLVDGLSLSIHHPEFAPYESGWLALAPELEIILVRGEMLVLSGWIDTPSNVIDDFDAPQFSDEVELEDGDWQTRSDGRRMTARVPLGRHFVQLRHWCEAGVYWSALTEFEMRPRATTELHLELQPSVRLRGRLSDEVPRPVIDGRVSVAVFRANPANAESSGFLRRSPTTIDAEGEFEIPFLRAERVQLIAICRGWVSPRVMANSPEDLGLALQPGEDWRTVRERLGEDALTYPLIELQALDRVLEVAMEPTATLEFHALDDRGSPLAGVRVSAWPNVYWEGVGSSMVAHDFSWSALTDDAGIARVDSLPAGEHYYRVEHPQFELPREPPGDPEGDRHRLGHFVSGATLRVDFALERVSDG